ncbi:YigZ family protein [Candidatus Viridilinea mediisalina]|uniref:YigZ family protein n=1 Tax=Candidatus Viridilinea mediisalina TaxID=2024553 RepID=A0A2A6RN60_9CHLR|nr:YigZ family protein [Candidatus Viridilinea mediisalina]PDW04524.1 YigZ family protein [Candidatus Viridilinea mediisalina]
MNNAATYFIPAQSVRVTLNVLNSRFIGTAGYTPSVAAARELIAAVREELPTASHHCYAYLIGYGASVTEGMSDDGEPSGTAGRPMLAVLRGADLGDVTVIATRYFGGTLLGTGGLVRAYSDTVRSLLAELPRRERITLRHLQIQVSYAAYAATRRILATAGAEICDEQFGTEVAIHTNIPASTYDHTLATLTEATAGHMSVIPSITEE